MVLIAFRVAGADSASRASPQCFTVALSDGSANVFLNALVGQPFHTGWTAAGPVNRYTWTSSGDHVPGLSFSWEASAGRTDQLSRQQLLGTPARAGSYTFTVSVREALPPGCPVTSQKVFLQVAGGASSSTTSTSTTPTGTPSDREREAKSKVGEALNDLGRALRVVEGGYELAAASHRDLRSAETVIRVALGFYDLQEAGVRMEKALAATQAALDAPTLPGVESSVQVAEEDLRAAEQVM